jgi:hypothetical protein
MLLELRQRSDTILELPFPIVPELGPHLGPIARRMRDELFSIDFACGKCVHFQLWKKTLRPLTIVSMQALFGARGSILGCAWPHYLRSKKELDSNTAAS